MSASSRRSVAVRRQGGVRGVAPAWIVVGDHDRCRSSSSVQSVRARRPLRRSIRFALMRARGGHERGSDLRCRRSPLVSISRSPLEPPSRGGGLDQSGDCSSVEHDDVAVERIVEQRTPASVLRHRRCSFASAGAAAWRFLDRLGVRGSMPFAVLLGHGCAAADERGQGRGRIGGVVKRARRSICRSGKRRPRASLRAASMRSALHYRGRIRRPAIAQELATAAAVQQRRTGRCAWYFSVVTRLPRHSLMRVKRLSEASLRHRSGNAVERKPSRIRVGSQACAPQGSSVAYGLTGSVARSQ